MSRVFGAMILVLGWIGNASGSADAQSAATSAPATIAIVGGTVVPMDRERVVPNQTILVSRGRIVAVGPTDSIAVPPGATVVDARGRFLAPGLADMHVHVALGSHPSAAFRDAPLYLANGVTTVLNLRGDSAQLAWRAAIAAGTLVAPTLYTSGRFVNEPLVNTPAEAEREVRAEAAAGYDVLKFREVVDSTLAQSTTHGLSRETYHRMMETAREVSIPVTGHAPNNLGLEAALEEKQSLAHVGYTLLASYFWPSETARFRLHYRLATSALALLSGIVVIGWAVVLVVLVRRRRLDRSTASLTALTTAVLVATWLGARELWDTDRPGDSSRIAAVSIAGGLVLVGALALAGRAWRVRGAAGRGARLHAMAAFLAVAALAGSAVGYWVPLVRRTTDRGLTTLAQEIARAGIWVTPTIQVYRSAEVAGNPEVRYVRIPRWWESFGNPPPARREWARRTVTFLERVVGVLHREGVPLLAGTDANWAFVIPGFALHDELALLAASGLSPYEVLRTATVEPARFLRAPNEFGTIAPGRRADLVVVAKNPLVDLRTLRTPLAVMTRGRWLAASELAAMLAPLATDAR